MDYDALFIFIFLASSALYYCFVNKILWISLPPVTHRSDIYINKKIGIRKLGLWEESLTLSFGLWVDGGTVLPFKLPPNNPGGVIRWANQIPNPVWKEMRCLPHSSRPSRESTAQGGQKTFQIWGMRGLGGAWPSPWKPKSGEPLGQQTINSSEAANPRCPGAGEDGQR